MLKKSDIENLNVLFLFHGQSLYIFRKKQTIGGHHTNYLSRGPN